MPASCVVVGDLVCVRPEGVSRLPLEFQNHAVRVIAFAGRGAAIIQPVDSEKTHVIDAELLLKASGPKGGE